MVERKPPYTGLKTQGTATSQKDPTDPTISTAIGKGLLTTVGGIPAPVVAMASPILDVATKYSVAGTIETGIKKALGGNKNAKSSKPDSSGPDQ